MTSTGVQRFGPYIILDRIGDGGMAEIFVAKMQGYSGFEKLIALKKILPRYSQNRTFAQMLINEAKLAASLQHFNVVQVLDLGEIDRQVFIAMEYVRGRDLAAVLSNTYRRRERLPLPLALCIGTEFMTGLDYAHRMRNSDGQPLGIIHRDISPQNVLISYEGEVKVTDFGIARVVAEKEGFQLPGNLHGKFGYMSPEQVMGQEIDQRSDIFSAGVVLYEMLTGQRLFRGKEHKETIKMIVSHNIPPPSTINSEVPPSVDRICAKALARDRNVRYQTMGAFLGELSRCADSLPRRAATRDLSVYMRRQFGNAQGYGGARYIQSESASDVLSVVSGFRAPSGISEISSMIGAQRTPLGELLINQGAINAGDLEIALAEQRARGGRIGELLLASGNISEEDLLRALSTQSGLPSISQEDLHSIPAPARLLKRFPREAAEATMMLPISVNDEARSVRLAVSDPYDDRAILETKVVLGVNDVVVFLAKRSAIRTAISKWYGEEVEPDNGGPDSIFAGGAAADVAAHAGPPVVLIADGDPSSIADLISRVEAEDCEVIVASDGKVAREICREKKPSVAIIDAALPKIDGFNILLELRSKNTDAAVFISSGRGDEERQAKALELGADDFIVKPFSLELTTSKIRREIQKRSGGRKMIAPSVQFNGVSGSLKDMTALDIMQSLELGKKTAHVVLQYTDGRSGEINIRAGDLRGCVAAGLVGEEAFYVLVRPSEGLFRIEYRSSPVPENIAKPNTYLMIEAMRRLDESVGSRTGSRPFARPTPSPPLHAPPTPVPSPVLPPVRQIAVSNSSPNIVHGHPSFAEISSPGIELEEPVPDPFLEPTEHANAPPQRKPAPVVASENKSAPKATWSDSASAWDDALMSWDSSAARRPPAAPAPSSSFASLADDLLAPAPVSTPSISQSGQKKPSGEYFVEGPQRIGRMPLVRVPSSLQEVDEKDIEIEIESEE